LSARRDGVAILGVYIADLAFRTELMPRIAARVSECADDAPDAAGAYGVWASAD
jgi:hypothetical protein